VYVWDADYPWDVRTEKMCAALTSAGHEVHIVARNRARRPAEETLPEGRVHRLSSWGWLGPSLDAALQFPAFCNPRWIAHLHRVTREVRPDVIVVRDLPLAMPALAAGRRHGVPVVLDMAENYPAMIQDVWSAGRQAPGDVLLRNPRIVNAVERYCVSRMDHIIVVIEESADRLAELGVDRRAMTVVSNTPPRQRVSAIRPTHLATAARPLHLAYIGLLEVPRGIAEMIDATGALHSEGLPVRLTIIGNGRDEELFHSRARELGLGPDVVSFLGYVRNREALDIIGTADIGVIPHHATECWNTTIPNKLFDYMAAGLAVVGSDAKPVERILRATGAGEVYRAGDADSLADAVRRLVDPAVRAARASAGRRAVLERYNWDADTEALLRTLHAVVRRPPQPTPRDLAGAA
jgi:glycosyltransferase involved in cell wall biosynthesis